jgi:hypothetical protein
MSCIGLEYFCFEGDGLWTTPDDELVALGTREMDLLGLIPADRVVGGAVVRMPKAYPVYDDGYADALAIVRRFVDGLTNFHPVGRNGMHKYNNQDHSMLTAMLAVENIQGANHDIWEVNADQDYHETVTRDEAERVPEYREIAATQPRVPDRIAPATGSEAILRQAFARLHRGAFGSAVGVVGALYGFTATAWLLLRGGESIGPRLALLGQFLPGYEVSWGGSLVLDGYLAWIRRKSEVETLED